MTLREVVKASQSKPWGDTECTLWTAHVVLQRLLFQDGELRPRICLPSFPRSFRNDRKEFSNDKINNSEETRRSAISEEEIFDRFQEDKTRLAECHYVKRWTSAEESLAQSTWGEWRWRTAKQGVRLTGRTPGCTPVKKNQVFPSDDINYFVWCEHRHPKVRFPCSGTPQREACQLIWQAPRRRNWQRAILHSPKWVDT